MFIKGASCIIRRCVVVERASCFVLVRRCFVERASGSAASSSRASSSCASGACTSASRRARTGATPQPSTRSRTRPSSRSSPHRGDLICFCFFKLIFLYFDLSLYLVFSLFAFKSFMQGRRGVRRGGPSLPVGGRHRHKRHPRRHHELRH